MGCRVVKVTRGAEMLNDGIDINTDGGQEGRDTVHKVLTL